jgi:ABC-type multidrug transport system ATPase subunit
MLYRDLSARENLEFFASLYGLADPAKRARQMLEMAGLWHRANDPIKAFTAAWLSGRRSHGPSCTNPQLLLADEPFAGLDAPSIASLEQLFADLHQAGKTNHSRQPRHRTDAPHRRTAPIILRGGRVVVNESGPIASTSAKSCRR